ncbi:hypothetical protein P171DRAFT_189706 [Karstenula rhodostoma CBS 690.94]|uniref:Uncharacterized protein n=1 Tax=Karstenula rhodostoma CBS 690.94 TaxID=1392251 RepID=A0A9P4PU38_9PLEO|nr:hypothetical protein P171DRAFT_189706 [Karstenula rhodostoma CBS 690.94]
MTTNKSGSRRRNPLQDSGSALLVSLLGLSNHTHVLDWTETSSHGVMFCLRSPKSSVGGTAHRSGVWVWSGRARLTPPWLVQQHQHRGTCRCVRAGPVSNKIVGVRRDSSRSVPAVGCIPSPPACHHTPWTLANHRGVFELIDEKRGRLRSRADTDVGTPGSAPAYRGVSKQEKEHRIDLSIGEHCLLSSAFLYF